MVKITGLDIYDINWGEGVQDFSDSEHIDFENDIEAENFVDESNKDFNKYSVNDEEVDRYLISKYGATAEDFCAEFIIEDSETI
jgi:hypothetical protein